MYCSLPIDCAKKINTDNIRPIILLIPLWKYTNIQKTLCWLDQIKTFVIYSRYHHGQQYDCQPTYNKSLNNLLLNKLHELLL